MTNPRPKRPFQQRMIDVIDRSRIRHEVLGAVSRLPKSWRRRYGSMVLGASLAIGGLGVPLSQVGQVDTTQPQVAGIAGEIVSGVTSGVQSAASTVSETVTPEISPVELSPEEIELVTEKAKEEFFKSEIPFGDIIYKEAKVNNLDPALVAAVVQTESRFIPTAKSGAGAQGLMQLMPRTGKWMGAKNLMNPHENVKAGAKYLKYLTDRFDGDKTMIVAAYNAGEGNVKRYRGVPPFRETRNYVKKVSKAESEYRSKLDTHASSVIDEAIAAPVSTR